MSVQVRVIGIGSVGQRDTARGPIFQINAVDGTEYSTFNGQMANQARQLVGQVVQLRYTEKQVEKNGQTYLNRYYEGAEPTGQPTTTGAMPVGQLNFGNAVPPNANAAFAAPPAPSRDTQIHRQTASKVAATMLAYLPENERTPDGLVAIAEYLVSYYENGPRTAQANGQPSYHDPVPPQDDIPF